MGALSVGVSSPLVKTVQQKLNQAYNQSVIAESGSYDEATAEAVSRFQSDSKLPRTGAVDDKTLIALNWASKTPIREINYNGKTYFLNSVEYPEVSKRLIKKAEAQTKWYVNMAKNVKGMWEEQNKVRGDNTFWRVIVEGATGADFPDAKMVNEAFAAANAIAAAAKSDDYRAYQKAVDDGSEKIRSANAALNKYYDELFTGGAKLVDELEDIKEGCVI